MFAEGLEDTTTKILELTYYKCPTCIYHKIAFRAIILRLLAFKDVSRVSKQLCVYIHTYIFFFLLCLTVFFLITQKNNEEIGGLGNN